MRVAHERDRALRRVGLDDVGAGDQRLPFSSGLIGVPTGTGQVNGSVIRYRNDATGWESLKVTVLVVSVIPLTVVALPAITAGAPTIMLKNESPGEASFGENIRSNVYLIDAPVIGVPFEKSSPGFSVNL